MISQLTDKIYCLLLTAIILAVVSSPLQAENSSRLLKLAQEKYNFQDNSYVITMKNTVRTKQKTDTAELKVYIYQGGKRQMATFTAPQRLKDQKYLVIGSNTWLYQQGLRRPIRISARQKLFGDAGIGETVGIDYYRDYRIESIQQTKNLYQFKLQAKDSKTAYQQAEVSITPNGYFDKIILQGVNGNPLKKINYQNYQQINGHEVAELVITNLLHKTNRTTKLQYLNIQERKLPAKAFQPLMMGKFQLLLNQAGN